MNAVFNEGGLIKKAGQTKQTYENYIKNEEQKMNELAQNLNDFKEDNEPKTETETITESIKGVFIKYDVEYTDTSMKYEYTSTNGWRLENYELAEDGKTLSNVRLISTGIPAKMYYYYNDKTNNYSKWITNSTKLEEFKNNVLGTDYYKTNTTYKALQASAGFYYNLGQMTFEQKTSYDKKNQGYYTKIKNGNVAYTSGETTGDNLFKTRSDASIRILTLPELNRALGREDIDSTIAIRDATGLYQLDRISTETVLTSNTYKGDSYWLASPVPKAGDILTLLCSIVSNGNVSYGGNMDYDGDCYGIRPLVSLTSSIQLIKKTDDTGFVYYEMVNVN